MEFFLRRVKRVIAKNSYQPRGGAGAIHWVPSVKEAVTPAATYAMAHLEPSSAAYRHVAQLAQPKLVPAAPVLDADAGEIQRHLIVHGYLRGAIYGTLGPATRAAIARDKRDKRLLQSMFSPQELLAYMKQR